MADPKQVEMLLRSVDEWNAWRRENEVPAIKVRLRASRPWGSIEIGGIGLGTSGVDEGTPRTSPKIALGAY